MAEKDRGANRTPERLKRRRDFLSAAKGARLHGRAFSVQAAATPAQAPGPRFGFTATKKVGGAVERNRIRRRLRELVRLLPDNPALPGHDYVILARREALSARFAEMAKDLRRAILGVNAAVHSRAARQRQNGRGAPASHPDISQRADEDQAIRR